MKFRTPQEKKKLSYAKDRRNRYGQSNKASRRLIPLNKTKGNRAARHAAASITKVVPGSFDDDSTARREAKAAKVSLKRWRKAPDPKLKDVILAKKQWRIRRFGRKKGKAVPCLPLIDGSCNSDLNGVDREGILNTRPA